MEVLAHSWQRAWPGLGAAGDGEALRRELLARHAEPQRHYHTLQHLEECLGHFEAARALAQRPHEVEMALWFHDAIYDVRAGDNERRSADWARQALTAAGVAADSVDRIDDLIMATRHDAAPADADARLLVDIDLSILGAPRPRFDEYERQIRQEYAFVPRWLFRRKRRAILRGFLERPVLYSTPHFREALESRARENLRVAITATTNR
ncbi:N-methyl-D-aspartate receptor NMDAR2C subunit [Pseudoxanthomonas mexicana]|uniref:HD domain-containing protein n=1 Tax=Pseudoxanthomonas mexicana TaxID=128785 RepID=UPI00398B57D7